ncbi:hypothetical protein [Microbulbifer sp. VAAF005]|uniref:hypothetical protein n=1 Tax=Microbulbifer sp. VAAF005 TaxID=3034230 RepID=UPI0024AE6CC2|nr:hypothetical protein [Microbulbifer sp. VAAF005]WHI45857.1 hypothetical protein P0078_19375 [Microbulbifer sp. VAAF005]
MNFKNQTLDGQELVLKDAEVNVLGPGLTLNRCTIVSEASAKALSFSGVSVVDSTFISKVTLADFQWCKVNLKGVNFLGRYSGCDFGQWEEFHGKTGGIVDCDFRGAELDNCRFMNCDVNSLAFPKWPYYTITSPRDQASSIKASSWPGKLELIMSIFADSPEDCVAVTGDANGLLKRLGGSEEEFKAALLQLDGIIC